MVKRSCAYYCSSLSGGNRSVAVVLVLSYLLCGVALASSLGRRSSLLAEQQRYNGFRDAEEVVAAAAAAAASRAERSAGNLSHIAGTARKIKMFIKNRYLQLYPDGTVNSTAEDTSDYGKSPPIPPTPPNWLGTLTRKEGQFFSKFEQVYLVFLHL